MGSIPVLCWQWGFLGLQFDSASRWSGPMEHKGEVFGLLRPHHQVWFWVGCERFLLAHTLGWDTAVLRLKGCFLDVVLYSVQLADFVWHGVVVQGLHPPSPCGLVPGVLALIH